MGEVYKARDARLGRDVALKVLPAEVATDPIRRQRFEREARAVASLNHPNVLAIYDVGTQDGIFYMVTELVDGESLRGIKLSMRRILDCAVQIATGLAAAHSADIVHRDLKPENILIARDGRVKILDFGLAKRVPGQSGSADTQTMPISTDPGIVMGTVGYMAPEQVRGQEADYRSDIFSFGLVLYELLGGRRAFIHETAVETMRGILKEDPAELPETVPLALRQIVSHCLEKEARKRFQSAQDLAFALEAVPQLSNVTGSIAPITAQTPRRLSYAVAAVSVLLIAALSAGAAWFLGRPSEPASWSAAILGGPEMALDPRLSPDGHLLAFQAMDHGLTQVAVVKPETGNWSMLTHDRSRGLVSNIAWSPDGALIYYDRITNVPQGIYSVPVLGGEERLVLEDAWRPESLPDGSILAGKVNAQRQLQLLRLRPESGRAEVLPFLMAGSPADNFNNTPVTAFPDGKHAAVFGRLKGGGESFHLLELDLSTGDAKRLLAPQEQTTPTAWTVARDGKSVIAALPSGSLTRIVSFPTDRRSAGRTLFTTNSIIWYLDTGPDGNVYASVTDRPAELVRRPITSDKAERIGSFPSVLNDIIAYLPDGRIIISALSSNGPRLMAVEKGKDPIPLINTTEETAPPVVAVGRREVAFAIGPAPRTTIALADSSTGLIARRISPGKGSVKSLAASPDGNAVYFAAGGSIWTIPASGGEARAIRAGDSVAADPSGRFLMVTITQDAKWRLYRVPLGGGTEQEVVPAGPDPLMDVAVAPNALSTDDLLLSPLQPRDSWFNAPGLLDTTSGRVIRLPSDDASDYHSMAWVSNTEMVALRVGLRSTLWRFKPFEQRR
jgi:dipeptidyl aminopeptidase/acylaminoacyl peptidase